MAKDKSYDVDDVREALFPGAAREAACTCPKFLCFSGGRVKWKAYAVDKDCPMHAPRSAT